MPIVNDGRQCFRLFPKGNGPKPLTWVYAIGLEGGAVKIGMTDKPRERLRQHWCGTRKTIQWAHLFAPFSLRRTAELVERTALQYAAAIGKRVEHTEIVAGITKAQAIQCVRAAIELLPERMAQPAAAIAEWH